MKLRNTLLGSTLLVAAFGSSALSLGRARGAVVLGQSLDLAVNVRLDSADDSGNACFEADVFHGDSQVAPSRVRVIVVSGSQPQEAVVRIRSSAVVDEPVVGVVLRSVCGQKTSRRYDFLTDFPVETHAAAVPTIIPAVVPSMASATVSAEPSVSPATPAPAPAPTVAPRVRVAPRATAAPIIKPPKLAPKPVEAKEPVAAAKIEAKAEVADNKPRLKLESADAPDTRQVQLKPSTDMLVLPTDDVQKREAAAAVWRELNNLPVENPQEKQRLLALEAESKTLKALLAKNEADFKLRLEKLESNRIDEGLVYGLGGLLLAALAAAAYWWNRTRQSLQEKGTDWAHHGEPSVEELGLPSSLSRPAPFSTQAPSIVLPTSPQDPEVDESLFEDLKKLTTVTMPVKPVAPVGRAAAVAEPMRGQQPDDFLDVQQHADFFVSLGQYDQAIDVLKKSIHESAESNPLVDLELLKIFHTLGRQADYNQQREVFNRLFNCQLPAFTAFTAEGKTLDNYPSVLSQIESLWGTPKVLVFIESCILRNPENTGIAPFDLAAYRELLLLYAMAKNNVRQMGGVLPMGIPSLDKGARASRPAMLDAVAVKAAPTIVPVPLPAVSDDSNSPETSFTQPMLLMPDPSAMASLDGPSEPAVPSYRQPLDLDLDLNLDFSNSELMAMRDLEEVPTLPAAEPLLSYSADLAPLDLDIDDLLASTVAASDAAAKPLAPAVPVIDSNMLEFDLFDPKIEAKISPKTK